MKYTLPILLFFCSFAHAQIPVVQSNSGNRVVQSNSGISFVFTSGNQTDVTFTLDTSSIVSVGIYDTDSTLVRTLISNQRLAAGSHTIRWDGQKDTVGVICPNGSYYACVLTNNVKWDWLRPIGNSSDSTTGSTVQHYFYGVDFGRVFAAGRVFTAPGYCEKCDACTYSDTPRPNQKFVIIPHGTGSDQATYFVATDGTNVYYLGQDPQKDTVNFVYAINASTLTEVLFDSGRSLPMSIGRTYPKAINIVRGPDTYGTGLAVQKNGNLLFVSHKYLHRIDILNKTTGAAIRNDSTVSDPLQMACDTLGNLWVLMTDRAIKFSVDGPGNLGTPLLTITGFQNALSVAVSPDNSKVTIVDGGSSQQVKCYNNLTGAALWTYGLAGGYTNGPRVTTSKFDFKNPKYASGEATYVTWQNNRSFWVGDPGTNSSLQYDSARNFVRRVQNMGFLYSVFVDQANPRRIFGNYLEYDYDYATNTPTLVRNWSNGIDIGGDYDDNQQRLKDVVTMSNGRTYALQHHISTDVWHIVDLDTTTGLRFTGVELPIRYNLYRDGSAYQMPEGTTGGTTSLSKKALTGFTSNNPQFASASNVATTPTLTSYDPVAWVRSAYQNQLTSSGITVTFDAGLAYSNGHGTGFHLGGVKAGKFMWKASPATQSIYLGSYPFDGSFDIANGVSYAGGFATSIDRNIFWNYHGEFWKASQTNKWNHYYDNGLMVGQFGVVGPDSDEESPYGMEGNTLTGGIVKDLAGNIHVYHAGESTKGAVSHWVGSRLNTIALNYVSLRLAGTVIDNTTGVNLLDPSLQSHSTNMFVNVGEFSTDRRNENTKLSSISSGTDTFGIAIPGGAATTNWVMSGGICYPEFDVDYPSDDNKVNYFEILDDQNKVIARLNRTILPASSIGCYINGVSYLSGPASTVQRISRNSSPIPRFTLEGNAEGVVFTYAGGDPITVDLADPTAHWNYPKRIRVKFIMGGLYVSYRVLNLQYLRIIKN